MDLILVNNKLEKMKESQKIMQKYPDKIPIIINKQNNCLLKNIIKNKFLVPKDITMSQFVYIIRKRIKLREHEALFIMINNNLMPSNMNMGEIYANYKSDDGYLYSTYTSENTFG